MTALRILLCLGVFLFWHGAASAAQGCTLVVDHATSEIIHESGDCKTRHGVQSTFKIPLALMGFDSGILKDAHHPVWPYEKSYEAIRDAEKKETDPSRWEEDSVVWFSQKLTRTMGFKKFNEYVQSFNYGNKDLSGDPGKNNGLTHAWLSSSLKISPIEQVSFIRGLLDRKFDISAHAYDMTTAIVPQFSAGGWDVHGKTGTGFEVSADGTLNRNRQQGWFVGWALKDDKKVVFAKFMADDKKEEGYAGPRTRDIFLQEIPEIMAQDRHNEH